VTSQIQTKEDLTLPHVSPGAVSPKPASIRPSNGQGRTVRAKKIWIDIDNSPHVPFFLPIIEELKKQNVELILTARDMYQVVQLLDFFKLSCAVIGGHYGKNKALKVLSNCVRAVQLVRTIIKSRPDLALSHGSRAQVLVSKALGIPTVLMHDYEHSTKTGFLEADWTLMPEVIPDNAMSRRSNRTLKYPGLKEDVYVPQFKPDPSIIRQLGVAANQLVVTLRPPATEAHYHNPESETLFAATIERLSKTPDVRAITLPRNARQEKQLRKDWAEVISAGHMIIPDKPVDGLNLIWFSDLVISGGGTMNREAAALGVPVYSIFRGKIGAVDQYLADSGRMALMSNVEDIQTKINLIRWNRPAKPDSGNRPALRSIVDNIIKIMESR
jgi:uncharacterized protein